MYNQITHKLGEETISWMNENIDKKRYQVVISSASSLLESADTPENVISEIKNSLLFCLDRYGRQDNNELETANNILAILGNHSIVGNLSNLDKSEFYSILGYNYFQIGDFNKCIDAYIASYKLGNKGIIEDIIITEMILDFRNIGNYKKIEEHNGLTDYSRILEHDLYVFFYGQTKSINDPKNLKEHIYNLELEEKNEINNIFYGSKKYSEEEVSIKEKNLEKELKSQYTELEAQGFDPILLNLAVSNMEKRFLGEDEEYQYAGKYLKSFIRIAFEIFYIYEGSGVRKIGKALGTLNYILDLGIKNLDEEKQNIIINFVDKLLCEKENVAYIDNIKETILSSLGDSRIFTSTPELGNIMLKLGKYYSAFEIFENSNLSQKDFSMKIGEICEIVLLKGSFETHFDFNEDENKQDFALTYDNTHFSMDPREKLSLYIKKLKRGYELNIPDRNEIKGIFAMYG